MKQLFFASVALFALAAAGPAVAADMPVKAPVYKAAPQVALYTWTGFYVGANGGYGWANNGDMTYRDSADEGATLDGFKSRGAFGGGQIGYNWQASGLVLGLEADIQVSAIRNSFGPISVTTNFGGNDTDLGSQRVDYFGTVRGRVGYVFDRTLLYLTGGYAYGKVKNTLNVNNFVGSSNSSRSGWVGGGGLEQNLAGNWSAKLEYQYIDLGSETLADPRVIITTRNVDTQFSTVRVGLNYKFDWGKGPVAGKGPVVTRY